MRREAGAVIVILICLLSKLPALVRDHIRLTSISKQEKILDSSSGNHTQPMSADDRPDSSHNRPFSTRAASGGDTSLISETHHREKSARSLSSPKTRFDVPQAYLDDPLAYLSSAPPESLVFLPGVGPVIAERIANAASGKRPFTRWEDLLSVKGIGPKKLEMLKQIAHNP